MNRFMSILRLQQLRKSFGALVVADNVSFEVAEGQALGIIGPNGAGKSTLISLIAGNLPVDSGHIEFRGRDVTGDSVVARTHAGIGRSFQIPRPFTKMTVFENLLVAATFGRNQSEADVEADCVEILRQTGMGKIANVPAGRLSLLERKRLELARGLASGPTLLLLDEIAGGLTEGECRTLVATIKDIHARGVTIVWIEHVLHALNAVVERLLVLDFGKVIAMGKPDEIMNSAEVKEIYLGIEA